MASKVELKSNASIFQLPNSLEQTQKVLNEFLEKGTIQENHINIREASDYLEQIGKLPWANSCSELGQRALCLLYYNAFFQDLNNTNLSISKTTAWKRINETALKCLQFNSIKNSKEYDALWQIMNKYGKKTVGTDIIFVLWPSKNCDSKSRQTETPPQ